MYTIVPKIADRIIEWGIIFLLATTPLVLPRRYGTIHLWTYTSIELTVFILLIILLIKLTITSITSNSKLQTPNSVIINRFGFVKTPLNIPIVLFVCLVLVQLIPLPPGILKSVSPNAYQLYKTALPGLHEEDSFFRKSLSSNEISLNQDLVSTSQVSSTKLSIVNHQSSIFAQNPESQTLNSELQTWMPLSIYSYATKIELVLILAYIGMYFIVVNTPGLRFERIVIVVTCVGFFISFLGILQRLTWTENIYWLIKAPQTQNGFFGTFTNRNHFAGYIEMVIFLSLGLLISRFGNITFNQTMTWRSILSRFESQLLSNIILSFAIIVMISALFLSLSRGGILSFAVTALVFLILIGIRRTMDKNYKKLMIIFACLSLSLVFSIWIGINPILKRLSDLSSPSRYEVFHNTFQMAKDFPVFGTGLGTFQYLYPKYDTLGMQMLWDHAHNDYIELLSDSGFLGILIVLGGIIFFIWKILKRWWKESDSYVEGVILGGVCSIVAILGFSFTDFNLHIPVNALFFSFILGLTHSVVNLKKH